MPCLFHGLQVLRYVQVYISLTTFAISSSIKRTPTPPNPSPPIHPSYPSDDTNDPSPNGLKTSSTLKNCRSASTNPYESPHSSMPANISPQVLWRIDGVGFTVSRADASAQTRVVAMTMSTWSGRRLSSYRISSCAVLRRTMPSSRGIAAP